jgi:aspartate oxidase
MKHESLVAIKTFRDFRTGLENRSERKIKTANSLCRTKKEQKILESLLDDQELSQARQMDIQRFAQQDLAIKKSQEKILKIRDKLAKTVNKNKQIIELRQKLQKGSWGKDHSSPQKIKRNFKPSNFKELKIDF